MARRPLKRGLPQQPEPPAAGRGRYRTRPSWMTTEVWKNTIGKQVLKEKEAAGDLEILMAGAADGVEDDPMAAPINALVLSKTVILRNAYSPKKLVLNPYLHTATDENGGFDTSSILREIEAKYFYECAQFGCVRGGPRVTGVLGSPNSSLSFSSSSSSSPVGSSNTPRRVRTLRYW